MEITERQLRYAHDAARNLIENPGKGSVGMSGISGWSVRLSTGENQVATFKLDGKEFDIFDPIDN